MVLQELSGRGQYTPQRAEGRLRWKEFDKRYNRGVFTAEDKKF
jgi:hypothetical protein